MSLDTVNKRASAISVNMSRSILPQPGTTITSGIRAMLANLYAFEAGTPPPVIVVRDGGDGIRRQVVIHVHEVLRSKAKRPPPPTANRVRALQREALQEAGGLFAASPETKAYAREEIREFYQPGRTWADLDAEFAVLVQKVRERIAAELDEEEEFLLLQ